MKFLLPFLLLSIAAAEAKDCYNGGSGLFSICVGDQLVNQNPANEQEVIGVLKRYKKDKYGDHTAEIHFPSGLVKTNIFITKFERSLKCAELDSQKICVGDVIKTKRSEMDPDNSLKVTHILETSGWSGKKDTVYLGYDKDGKFGTSSFVVIDQGSVPGFPALNFGDSIPRTNGTLVRYDVRDGRYEIKIPGEYHTKILSADQLRARLGETEMKITQERDDSFDRGHVPKDQKVLFERYKGFLERECQNIFRNSNGIVNSFPIIEVTDISVEIQNTKNNTQFMIGAECLPLPIPWIYKSATIQYKASGICKFHAFEAK